ncbi:hypothetical protein [Marinicella litoralis]|nr:hypothetical protein [Marinicella litoralis]
MTSKQWHKNSQSGQDVSWLVFGFFGTLAFAIVLVLGIVLYPEPSNQLGIGQYITGILFSSAIIGGSPGIGLLTSAMAVKLKQKSN